MSDEELTRARETIERQQREIDALRRRLEDERFAQELRDTLVLAASAGTIGSPVGSARLLESILRTAARAIGATAGSVYSIKEHTGELAIEVAFGPKAEEVKGLRVPLGRGISGLVAVSGQPMAVSRADEDPRVYQEIGERIGYEPQSLLAVPLLVREQVVGVLQLIDKAGGGTFTPADIDVLAEFAEQAGTAIELTRTFKRLAPLLADVLVGVADAPGVGRDRADSLRRRSQTFAVTIEEEPGYLATMELASLVQEIAWSGDDELKVCQQILRSFSEYLRSRPDPFGGEG